MIVSFFQNYLPFHYLNMDSSSVRSTIIFLLFL